MVLYSDTVSKLSEDHRKNRRLQSYKMQSYRVKTVESSRSRSPRPRFQLPAWGVVGAEAAAAPAIGVGACAGASYFSLVLLLPIVP